MNERTLRPGHIGAAAVLIAGILMMALPQYGMSIVRLALVTIAVAAGLYALAVSVPEWSSTGWWMSPFNRLARTGDDAPASAEIDRLRSALAGRRQRIGHGPPVPPEVLRLLKPLITMALEREGLDPDDDADVEAARDLLTPLTRAVLTSEEVTWPRWFRTVRADEHAAADVVHAVLDDLERIGGGPEPRTRTAKQRTGPPHIADSHSGAS